MPTLSDQLRGNNSTVAQLKDSVMQMWDQYDWRIIERAFAILHQVYRLILLHGGGNQYNLPDSHVCMRQNHAEETIDLAVPFETKIAGELARNHIMFENLPQEEDSEDEGEA